MTATNDDLLAELQKQTLLLRKIKNLIKGEYGDIAQANATETNEA